MAALAELRIQTRPGTHAVPTLGYYRNKYGVDPSQFPNAILAEDTTLTLPLFPGMAASDIDVVVDALSRALAAA